MTQQAMDLRDLRLLAGQLALDFVNSIENRASDAPIEFLTSYAELVRWARHAGVLSDEEVRQLLAQAARDEPAAREVLVQALRLRDALHRVCVAIATGGEPDSVDLEQVQGAYARALQNGRLRRGAGRFAWEWPHDGTDLESVLWPLARSAIELLTEGDPRRIKLCANPHGCGWLFYDGSKNGSRRWCSMEGCGSQIKMRRQYAKRRAVRRA